MIHPVVRVAILISFNGASWFSFGWNGVDLSSRKVFLEKMSSSFSYVTTTSVIAPSIVNALDMDAFMQKELDNETCNEKLDKKCKPKLSADEALCRFGQPSPATGKACERANMSAKRPGSPVDAYGNIDRGDYERCKPYYIDGPRGTLVKQYKCE